MLTKFKTLLCSSLVAIFTLVAVGSAMGCPVVTYQPEPPKRD
ncbi:MAG: AgrD family cyclic lactone autoinducer peptide [Syntrophomonadaceae bacterium]|jgi:cyclic lactone autoinducer peptide